jgi:hypothetical protein
MHKILIVIKSKNEDKETLEMKILLCKIGKKLDSKYIEVV